MRGTRVERIFRNWPYGAALTLVVLTGTLLTGAYAIGLALGLGTVGAALAAGVLWFRLPQPVEEHDDFHPQAAWAAVDAEVRRSRRHGRSFVLLAVRGDLDTARLLRPLLRAPDQTWIDDSVVYVLLTDCDASGAAGFINRTRLHLPQHFRLGQFGLGVFPTDGVTMGGLIQAALGWRVPAEIGDSVRTAEAV